MNNDDIKLRQTIKGFVAIIFIFTAFVFAATLDAHPVHGAHNTLQCNTCIQDYSQPAE